jgi:hypothetical protein
VARVLALIPDLLFGSRVQADLVAGGHEVELIADRDVIADPDAVHARLGNAEVLVVDLTDEGPKGSELVEGLRAPDPNTPDLGGSGAAHSRPSILGFYSHVDAATRERAERAGFDLVVPRSRMAREAAVLVDRLAGG